MANQKKRLAIKYFFSYIKLLIKTYYKKGIQSWKPITRETEKKCWSDKRAIM